MVGSPWRSDGAWPTTQGERAVLKLGADSAGEEAEGTASIGVRCA